MKGVVKLNGEIVANIVSVDYGKVEEAVLARIQELPDAVDFIPGNSGPYSISCSRRVGPEFTEQWNKFCQTLMLPVGKVYRRAERRRLKRLMRESRRRK